MLGVWSAGGPKPRVMRHASGKPQTLPAVGMTVNNGTSNEVGKRVRTGHQILYCVKRVTATPRSGVEWAAYTRRMRQESETNMRCWARLCQDGPMASPGFRSAKVEARRLNLLHNALDVGAAWIRLVDLSAMAGRGSAQYYIIMPLEHAAHRSRLDQSPQRLATRVQRFTRGTIP